MFIIVLRLLMNKRCLVPLPYYTKLSHYILIPIIILIHKTETATGIGEKMNYVSELIN